MKGYFAVARDVSIGTQPRAAPAFRWSWRFATFAGISVYTHATRLFAGHGPQKMVPMRILVLAVFAAVVLNECRRALTARRAGEGTG